MNRTILPWALSVLIPVAAATAQKAGQPRKIVDRDTKKSYSAVIEGASGARLVCTGAGCRKKTMFAAKVYVLVHWIDAEGAAETLAKWKGKSGKQLAADPKFLEALTVVDVEKRLRFDFVRAVTAKQVREGFVASLRDSKQRKEFVALFRADMKVGDHFELRWLPGGVIEVHEKGKKAGALPANPKFAAEVWRQYFGKKMVDSHLAAVKPQLVAHGADLWRPLPAKPEKKAPTSRPTGGKGGK